MLHFIEYSYENLKTYASVIRQSPYLCNDISVGSFFIWHQGLHLEFAVYNSTFIAKLDLGDGPAFSYPFGKDIEGALDALEAYVKEQNLALMFFCVEEELLKKIRSNPRFLSIHASYDRRWSDYIYDFEQIVSFAGRKFSSQRNHINKFKKLHGEPDFRPITSTDIPMIEEMLDIYQKSHENTGLEGKELRGTKELLHCYKELGMYGGVLYINTAVAAFTIGEIVGDMCIIHVEKALTKYPGVYPTTFHYFMKYMQSVSPIPLRLINREDDAGDIGLRTSKLQYRPIQLLHKYNVHVNSPLQNIETIPTIYFDGGVLNAITETDKENYFLLSTDKDNNKYWGYDYEEDRNITEVNIDTFYNSQAYDYSLGASITFAIRMHPDSELIGETIIYHFTANGEAEIGGRITKKQQGKGLGTKAFAATADFAKNTLKVTPIAKCFKENTASYHMITNSGFAFTHEDDTFYYFKRD